MITITVKKFPIIKVPFGYPMYGRPQRTPYSISLHINGKRVVGGSCANSDPKHHINWILKGKKLPLLNDDELTFIMDNTNRFGFWSVML